MNSSILPQASYGIGSQKSSAFSVGDVLERLCGRDHVTYQGASLYHDEFGHIISSIALTRWPEDPRLDKPVVWSTEAMVPEQLAELCQRMLLRASRRNIASGIKANRIHVKSTLDDDAMARVEANLWPRVAGEPLLHWPDQDGKKLTKDEALAWVYLYTLEDVHIFARHLWGREMDLDQGKLADYTEKIAELMYAYAIDPSLCKTPAYRAERDHLVQESYALLALPKLPKFTRAMAHFSDTLLESWYDIFLPHFDALDEAGMAKAGKCFSNLGVEALREFAVTDFLPQTQLPFEWVFEGEEIKPASHWTGVLTYESERGLYLIGDVIPPQRLQAYEVGDRAALALKD